MIPAHLLIVVVLVLPILLLDTRLLLGHRVKSRYQFAALYPKALDLLFREVCFQRFLFFLFSVSFPFDTTDSMQEGSSGDLSSGTKKSIGCSVLS